MSATVSTGDEPLSEREQRMVDRLFSDPTLFPASMKTWLVSYLEASDMILPISSVHGLSAELNKLSTPAVRLKSGESFTLFDSAGDPILVVDEDGTFHGRAGKALTFDL